MPDIERIRMKKIVGGVAALALLLAGCGSTNAGGAQPVSTVTKVVTSSGPTVTVTAAGAAKPGADRTVTKAVTVTAAAPATTAAAVAKTEAPPAAGAASSRTKPLPAGSTTVVSPSWKVQLGKTNLDAWSAVKTDYGINDEPKAGMVDVLVPVTATYSGDGSQSPGGSLIVEMVGSDGTVYGSLGGSAELCIAPKDLSSANEVYSGATAKGDVCVQMPTAQLKGAAWRVRDVMQFDDPTPAFFATK